MSGDELPMLSGWGGESPSKGLAAQLTLVQRVGMCREALGVSQEDRHLYLPFL